MTVDLPSGSNFIPIQRELEIYAARIFSGSSQYAFKRPFSKHVEIWYPLPGHIALRLRIQKREGFYRLRKDFVRKNSGWWKERTLKGGRGKGLVGLGAARESVL